VKSKLLILSAVVALLEGGVRAEETPAAEIIADQIRDQGYSCHEALTAERDPTYSRPDEAAWILECDNATYRVRLVPGLSADVERLDG
jgi:hypothetical protein